MLTDNGTCYRSKVFAKALAEVIAQMKTCPYRPQTSGNVERFNRALATERAGARAYLSEPNAPGPIKAGDSTTITIDPAATSKARHPPTAYAFTTYP